MREWNGISLATLFRFIYSVFVWVHKTHFLFQPTPIKLGDLMACLFIGHRGSVDLGAGFDIDVTKLKYMYRSTKAYVGYISNIWVYTYH